MAVSHKELYKEYLVYRQKYFPNLPEDVNVVFAPTDCYGEVWLDDKETWTIRIDPKYAIEKRMWQLTLLHEMSHMAIHPYQGHGKKFQKEMLRLADAGALRKVW